MTNTYEWKTMDSAPKDRQFYAMTEGLLIRQIADISGFLSGCDNGPDVIEKNIPPIGRVAWWAEEESVFFADDGETYDMETFVVSDMSLPPDEIEGGLDKISLQMTMWCDLPELPPSNLFEEG